MLFLDRNGRIALKRDAVAHVWLVEQSQLLSPEELFSQRYLYGDYTKLNAALIVRYGLHLPENPLWVDNPFGLDTGNLMEHAYEEIHRYLEEGRHSTGEPVLLGVESMEWFIEQAAQDFWRVVEQYGKEGGEMNGKSKL